MYISKREQDAKKAQEKRQRDAEKATRKNQRKLAYRGILQKIQKAAGNAKDEAARKITAALVTAAI